MSRLIVRRLTTAITLVAVLCVAAPAMAAAPARSHSRAPLVLGTGLFDQILSWLGSLLPDHEAQPQGSQEKTGTSLSGSEPTNSSLSPLDDRGGMIDPNGGS